MNKQEFISRLQSELTGLPKKDIEDRVGFYNEMIEDRMEEGLSEQEAVLSMGSINDIISQIVKEIPLVNIVKERIKEKRRLSTWEMILLCVGFPVWGALLISAFAVVFSIYVSLWAILISIFAVEVSFLACSAGFVFGGIIFSFSHLASGIALIGASLICAGLSIYLYFLCKILTKSIILFSKKLVFWLKMCFVRKGEL